MRRSAAIAALLLLFSLVPSFAQTCTSPSGVVVTMCSPADGATVTSPVRELVATNDPGHHIKAIYTYVDDVVVRKDYDVPSVDAPISMTPGAHELRVQVWDEVPGVLYKAGVNVTVATATSTACSSPAGVPVTICSPADGTTVSSPVHELVATNDPGHHIKAIYSYVDGVVVRKDYNVPSVDAQLAIAPGAHEVRVQVWNEVSGTVYKAASNILVGAPTGAACVSPASAPVTMCSPGDGATVTSPVHELVATNDPGHHIKAIYTYLDNVVVRKDLNVPSVDAQVPVAPGKHNLRVQVWNEVSGVVYKTGSNFNVMANVVSVAVSPQGASVAAGQAQQFQATVSGAGNTAVNWSVDGIAGGNSSVGTIDAAGLYIAPTAAGSHTVTATSVADSTQRGSAAITVTSPAANRFTGLFRYHGDNLMTGLNSAETVLTPANVNPQQFGKLFTRPLDGSVFAQPLYVPNVNIPGQGVFNVVYIETEHDSVYAYDADGKVQSPLWQVSFIDPSEGITTIPAAEAGNYDEGPEVGISSTPVIDPTTSTMYLVAATKENGAYFQKLHALDLATGAEKLGGPVAISGSVSGNGRGSVNGVQTFNPQIQNQRAALLLANGNLYIGFGSHGDFGDFHGWLFAYDAASLGRVAVINTTPDDWAGGIWSAGAGPAADSQGNIYTVTGNGGFNLDSGGRNVGDTFLKLSPSLNLVDSFTPFDQAHMDSDDLDVGSSGVLLIADDQAGTSHPHILVGSDKSGDLFVIDRDRMGGYLPTSNNNIVQFLPRALGNNTSYEDQYFGVAAYWNGNLYFAGAYDYLKQFSLANALLSATPIAQSPEQVAQGRSARPVVSSNGDADAIVWLITTEPGASAPTLRAYDATNIGRELYNTSQNPTRDTPSGGVLKFNSPTIANGRVYFAAQGSLNVYGLLPANGSN